MFTERFIVCFSFIKTLTFKMALFYHFKVCLSITIPTTIAGISR
jgi:hypothetical protein